jgi:hypothetical protein
MKKWVVLVVCLILAGTSSAYTDEPDGVAPSFEKHYREIGPEIFYDKYEEPGMNEKGIFYGIVFNAYDHGRINGKWMSGFECEFAYAKLDYDGALSDGTPYSVSNLKDWLVDVRFLGGADFPKADRLDTLYVGIGYRYLRDDSSFDPAGYLRRSNYLYLPIGLKAMSCKKNGWSLGGSAEFDFLMLGLQVTDLSDLGGPSVSNFQRFGSGYGVRAAVSIENKGDKTDFKIQPFVRYWHIDESDPDKDYGAFIEPENKTTQYGLQLIWTF